MSHMPRAAVYKNIFQVKCPIIGNYSLAGDAFIRLFPSGSSFFAAAYPAAGTELAALA